MTLAFHPFDRDDRDSVRFPTCTPGGGGSGRGGAVTVTGFDTEFAAPASSVTVKVTTYVPATAYVSDGAARMEVLPLPKFQA